MQFNPVGTSKFTSACDVAKAALVKRGVPYSNRTGATEPTAVFNRIEPVSASIHVGDTVIPSYDATSPDAKTKATAFDAALGAALKTAGYPAAAAKEQINTPMVTLLLWILVIYVTMVYAPIAAMLVEMFPTRIRYTSMSLPYHIGNGWFAIVAATGSIYSGLWYPIAIAVITLVIGVLFVKETKDVDIRSDTLANEVA